MTAVVKAGDTIGAGVDALSMRLLTSDRRAVPFDDDGCVRKRTSCIVLRPTMVGICPELGVLASLPG